MSADAPEPLDQQWQAIEKIRQALDMEQEDMNETQKKLIELTRENTTKSEKLKAKESEIAHDTTNKLTELKRRMLTMVDNYMSQMKIELDPKTGIRAGADMNDAAEHDVIVIQPFLHEDVKEEGDHEHSAASDVDEEAGSEEEEKNQTAHDESHEGVSHDDDVKESEAKDDSVLCAQELMKELAHHARDVNALNSGENVEILLQQIKQRHDKMQRTLRSLRCESVDEIANMNREWQENIRTVIDDKGQCRQHAQNEEAMLSEMRSMTKDLQELSGLPIPGRPEQLQNIVRNVEKRHSMLNTTSETQEFDAVLRTWKDNIIAFVVNMTGENDEETKSTESNADEEEEDQKEDVAPEHAIVLHGPGGNNINIEPALPEVPEVASDEQVLPVLPQLAMYKVVALECCQKMNWCLPVENPQGMEATGWRTSVTFGPPGKERTEGATCANKKTALYTAYKQLIPLVIPKHIAIEVMSKKLSGARKQNTIPTGTRPAKSIVYEFCQKLQIKLPVAQLEQHDHKWTATFLFQQRQYKQSDLNKKNAEEKCFQETLQDIRKNNAYKDYFG